jgi:hypothetical protein
MANRAYLYASQHEPTRKTKARYLGLSESAQGIPLSYMVMVSTNTNICTSAIWDTDDLIALSGDFKSGRERLSVFLDKINYSPLKPKIEETKNFLNKSFKDIERSVLEPLEIFEFYDEHPVELTQMLAGTISNIEDDMEHTLTILNSPESSKEDLEYAVNFLGIHDWSEVLYHDFSENLEAS